jgi:hypothetical protein
MKFTRLQVIRRPTFIDYITGGLQLNLITAIDFTASNGSPASPTSLHYIAQGALNQYETCIQSVGSIVCPYDSDQQFAVYGFGGEFNGQTSHCFPLTCDYRQPHVQGLEGIMGVYRQALGRVVLSGPTLFTPVVTAATQLANDSWASSHTYTILMIITDGCINDMQDTIDAIVTASNTALSIIIVGVGRANFDAMVALDGDEDGLRSRTGTLAARDIVQFVPFSQGQGNQVGLAAEVLAEIPSQVDLFCSTHDFVPTLS